MRKREKKQIWQQSAGLSFIVKKHCKKFTCIADEKLF